MFYQVRKIETGTQNYSTLFWEMLDIIYFMLSLSKVGFQLSFHFEFHVGKRVLRKISAISLTPYTPYLKLGNNLLEKTLGKHFIKYLHVNRGS